MCARAMVTASDKVPTVAVNVRQTLLNRLRVLSNAYARLLYRNEPVATSDEIVVVRALEAYVLLARERMAERLSQDGRYTERSRVELQRVVDDLLASETRTGGENPHDGARTLSVVVVPADEPEANLFTVPCQ